MKSIKVSLYRRTSHLLCTCGLLHFLFCVITACYKCGCAPSAFGHVPLGLLPAGLVLNWSIKWHETPHLVGSIQNTRSQSDLRCSLVRATMTQRYRTQHPAHRLTTQAYDVLHIRGRMPLPCFTNMR